MVGQIDGKVAHPTNRYPEFRLMYYIPYHPMEGQAKKPVFSPNPFQSLIQTPMLKGFSQRERYVSQSIHCLSSVYQTC